MTPQQTLKQILDLTEALVGISLSNEQNFPSTHGDINGVFSITISKAEGMSVALKNIAYQHIYEELSNARCFNFKMIDGALMLLRYRFAAGEISEHSLGFFPAPNLEHFQNEPELYLEDEIYADVVARNIVTFPVRFDYNRDESIFVEVHHPYSHLTLGQYKNCRIPVCAPLGPLAFGEFILRNFYNTAFRKYSDAIPSSPLFFNQTITENERKIMHVMCVT